MFFVLLGITGLLWEITFLVLKNWAWSGVFAVLSVLLVCSLFKESSLLISVFLVGALGIIVLGGRINWKVCTVAANVVALVIVVLLCGLVYRESSIPTTLYKSVDDLPQGPVGTYPDIYLLILDTYLSSREAESQYGFDNSVFTDGLSSRGFQVTENYTTSYPSTIYSIPSIMNMDYPMTCPDPKNLFRESPVLDTLGNLGYTRILLGSGWYPTAYSKYFDYNLQVRYSGLEGFKQLVLFRSKTVYGRSGAFRLSTPYQFSNLVSTGPRSESTFVFAHMHGAHIPYSFGPDGGVPLGGRTQSELFIGQLQYVNSQVLKFLDNIGDLNSSIVIITSDHGNFPQDSPLLNSCVPNLSDPEWDTFITSRFSGFQAVHLPGQPNLSSQDLIQPNVFRTIFRQYFNMSYPDLESKNYFVENRCQGEGVGIMEVTNLLEVR
jgi:hypothetical protein